MTGPILRSERLVLTPLGESDLEAAHALWTEPEVREFLWDGEIISRDRALEPLRGSTADFRESGFGLWALRISEAPELIGFCGLRRAELMPEPELLFGLRASSWGRGLAREAAERVLGYGIGELELLAIGATADVPNVRSIALLIRLGMTRLPDRTLDGRPTAFFRLDARHWRPAA